MTDDGSGDGEEDEGEEDWLRQGWRSEAGMSWVRSVCTPIMGKGAVSWLKILAANPNPNSTILSHETAT